MPTIQNVPQPVKPIYNNGRLIGIEDPNKKQSRLPTPQEQIIYGKQPQNSNQPSSTPNSNNSRGSSSNRSNGGGQSRINPDTGRGEYILEDGTAIPATQENYNKIVQRGTLLNPQESVKSAVNVPEYGGVVTSDNKFYPTTNRKFIPEGYEKGFLDRRQTNNGEVAYIIPKRLTPYAQSTREGVTITKPKEINNQNSSKNNGVSGSIRNDYRSNNSVSNYDLDKQEVKKDFWQEPTKRFLSRVATVISAPFISGGKITYNQLSETPIIGKITTQIEDITLGNNDYGREALVSIRKDKPNTGDVVNVATLALPFTRIGKYAFGLFGAKSVYSAYKEPSPENIADATLGSLAILPIAGKTIRSTYIKATSDFVSTEEVFSSQVLKEGKIFPFSKNPEQTVSKFKETFEDDYLSGTHTTSEGFKAKIISTGKRAEKGLEDTGLYITPKGEASPYFLNIKSDISEYKFTLNPLKNIINKPSVVNVKFKDINRLPENIVQSEGFEQVNKFLQLNAASGEAFVTARSERGLRGIKNLGQTTSEMEAVVPTGTVIVSDVSGNILQRARGYSKYTKYEGEVVPIREYKTLNQASKEVSVMGEAKGYAQKSIEYYSNKNNKYVSPYSITNNIIQAEVSDRSEYKQSAKQSVKEIYTYTKETTYSQISDYSTSSSVSAPSYSSSSASSNGSGSSSGSSGSSSYSSDYAPGEPSYYPSGDSYGKSVSYGQSKGVPYYYEAFSNSSAKKFNNSDSNKEKIRLLKSLKKAYQVLIKEKGEFKVVASDLPYGKAKLFGSKATKRSTSARFKLRQSGLTDKSDIAFNPSNEIFRDYKISKGKKIQLENEYIEKRGKRLTTYAEVSALQASRKKNRRDNKMEELYAI